jgi:acetyl-CoA C-acetyltransferase
MDLNTPVLVGIHAIQQRAQDPHEAVEAIELMVQAVTAAAQDAGNDALLHRVSTIRVPRGMWAYADPGRLIGDRIGAPKVHTVLAELGVLQQTLITDACVAIAEGREEIAIVSGGETKYRDQLLSRAGETVPETGQGDISPDTHLVPAEPILHPLELERGLMMPVRAFAILDNHIRYSEKKSLAEHQSELSELMLAMSEIASGNPAAWQQETLAPEDLLADSKGNRPLSFPYHKRHASNWSVNQASAMIFCSVGVARELNIPEEKWVYPVSSAESWHVVPVFQRGSLGRSKGAELATASALALADRTIEQVDHVDLYSCFPSPVRILQRELGLASDRAVTVTGGMASAGGPLNNYVLQATVRMAEVLRTQPGQTGMTTCVSGFLNKFGAAIWASTAPAKAFQFENVTDEVIRQSDTREVAADYEGPATVASYTVVYMNDIPIEAVAVCDVPGGARTVAIARDPVIAAAMLEGEQCGREVLVGKDGALGLTN